MTQCCGFVRREPLPNLTGKIIELWYSRLMTIPQLFK